MVNSINLQSILLTVLIRVYRSSLNLGQWRKKCEVDIISKPQLQIGLKQSWKLCLVLTQMTHSYAQPRDKSNTFIIITIKNITLGRSNKFQNTIFEINATFEFRRVRFKLFHPMILEGKKTFLKKLCQILKRNVINVSCSMCMVFFWY